MRWTRLVLTASLALTAAACTLGPSPTPTPTPSVGSSATASGGPSAPAPSSTPPPTATAAATPCPAIAGAGLLPSDRLVDLAVSSTPTHDLLTFVFVPSAPGPGGPPRGTLDEARPPFTFAGSGQPIDLLGEHALQVRFTGMTIASETGAAIYRGPPDVRPNLPALREAIQFDAFEGVVGWYIGYDGPGCVALERDGNEVTVMIAHPGVPTG